MACTLAVLVPALAVWGSLTDRALPLGDAVISADALIPGGAVIRDDWGRSVATTPRPARIVVLAPHLTELIAAAGALDQVIAIDANSDYPPEVAGRTRIRSYPAPGIEQLLALRAQWVLAWAPGISRRWVEALERAGIQVFVSDPRTLAEVATTLDRLAAISARPTLAREAARVFRQRLARIERSHQELPRLPVFYQVWARPLVSLGTGDVTADAIRICGARNIFADIDLAAPQVTEEAVLAARPRLIVASDRADSLLRWQRLGAIAPQGFARFGYLEASAIQRPGPRILDAVEQICELVEAAR